MKLKHILIDILNDKAKEGMKFIHNETEYHIKNNKIYYYNEIGIECELKNIKLICLNDRIKKVD